MISPIFDDLKSKFELGVYRSIHFQKHPSLVCWSHPHVIPIVGKKSPFSYVLFNHPEENPVIFPKKMLMELDGIGWNWMELDGIGWNWMELDGIG